MNSFVQANEQTVVDLHSIYPKLKQIPKVVAFFIYYQHSTNVPTSTHLQKLSFFLKQQKNWNNDKQQSGKNVLLHFIDLGNDQQVEQSFFQLKMQLLQSPKIKLIFYSEQSQLLNILSKALFYEVDLSHIPSALYSPDLHGDLTQHLGWREAQLGDLSLRTSSDFEKNVKKWISSPGQRIDMWSSRISVDAQEGKILRFDKSSGQFISIQEKEIQQYFISHLAIGHHAQLALNYQSRRKQHDRSIMNKLIFGIESLKKFCCIGNPSLQNGIISVMFKDEKGNSQQITKQLVKQGSKRGILTLLFSNIDKYMGMKLEGGRLNDGRIQMGVYQSSNQFRLVGSSNGQVTIRFNVQQVFLSVNNTCFKLLRPRQIKISLWGKIRVLISKQSLQC